MTDRPDLLESPDLQEDLDESPTGLGSTPRFPTSPSRSRQSPPSPNPAPGQEEPSGPTVTESSTASTEPDEEWVDPKDLQAAIRQTVDVGFVLVGHGFGIAEQRAKRLAKVDPKWTPTPQEREAVQAPAARLAKRHVKAPAQAMDTLDICLIAAGVGSFAVRASMAGTTEGTPDAQA